jgi:hypothetical protein
MSSTPCLHALTGVTSCPGCIFAKSSLLQPQSYLPPPPPHALLRRPRWELHRLLTIQPARPSDMRPESLVILVPHLDRPQCCGVAVDYTCCGIRCVCFVFAATRERVPVRVQAVLLPHMRALRFHTGGAWPQLPRSGAAGLTVIADLRSMCVPAVRVSTGVRTTVMPLSRSSLVASWRTW